MSCFARPEEVTSTNYVRNGKAMLAPLFSKDDGDKDLFDLFDHMKETGKNTGVKSICKSDTLIK